MRCKNCGGVLSFQNGIYLCESCGEKFAIDSIYEKTDVYICYEESDAAGRRTKDSIIAQEVYRRLEENKIATFYERISADGMIGSDLESGKLAALRRAKAIIVLGSSVEAFAAMETKYGSQFTGKPVIPFCIDVNPGAIPKTLSKIQAMSYSTIGWDKDLLKGIFNILGRVPESDTLSLYKRGKNKIILLCAIMAIVVTVAAVVAWRYFASRNTNEALRSSQAGKTTISQTQEATEPTAGPLTQSEIYENAMELLANGKYLEAAAEFSKIADYKDCSNQVKKIYDRYDGYYQDDGEICALYLNIIDGKIAEFSFEKIVNNKVVKVEDSLELKNNQITGKYIDNLSNKGSIAIALSNESVGLTVSTETADNDAFFGEISEELALDNKSDRPPMKTVTKELLLNWITNPISPEEITALGFELEYIDTSGEYNSSFGAQYRIANTDVVIIATDLDLARFNYEYIAEGVPRLENAIVIAAIAPVKLLCPEKIGSSSCVFAENDIAYVPTACDIMGPQVDRYWSDNQLLFEVDGTMGYYTYWQVKMSTLRIEENSKVGIISNKFIGEQKYQQLIETHKEWYLASKG